MNLVRLILRAIKTIWFTFRVYNGNVLNPDAVIIIFNDNNFLYWLGSDPSLKDRLAYKALRNNGFSVNVLFNPSEKEILSQPKTALAWLNPHHYMFSRDRRVSGYKKSLHSYVKFLDDHFDSAVPNANDIKYWENKVFMHEKLNEFQIRHPKTKIELNPTRVDWKNEIYPMILKTEDGYSSNGLWHIEEYRNIPSEIKNSNMPILIQEFLNITFDIRVICSFGRVVSFYWRRNPKSDEWQPTATQNGSTVQFIDLPNSAKVLAEEIFKKTGCVTYGADICYKNDDLTSDPYILEFSPIYQPNPVPPNGLITQTYSKFKKKSFFNYDSAFERLNYEIFNSIILENRMAKKHNEKA
jgi:hypothetical protein